MELLTTATARDEAERNAEVAVLPIGSFEQHGDHLPLITDTAIACIIANEVAKTYPVTVLPPITISCSHEHAAWRGTVSISARTLHSVITDIADSLKHSGISRLAIINGHGGNYVLSNIVQEANIHRRWMTLFPASSDWRMARDCARLETSSHDDMHAGELETSVLLSARPELVDSSYLTADHAAADRPFLLTLGMNGYTDTGVIGSPSLASEQKGKALLKALSGLFAEHLKILR